MRNEILTQKAASPKGPYSQAIAADGPMLFVSGQGPVDPESGEFQLGTFGEQAELTFQNITAILQAAGTSWKNVIRVGIFLADLGNFGEMNEIYERYLSAPYPARTTVQAGLPPKMQIEVDCIAVIPQE
jgi:2-iminobutanoate/2-iminopropanoate deaminase